MRVTFRAQFAGPIGKLNPSGWKWKSPLPQLIEVFQRGENWLARDITTRRRADLEALGKEKTHGSMKDAVTEAFEFQQFPWQMYGPDGGPLDPEMVIESPDGSFSKQIVTHIAADNQIGMPGNQFRTFCRLTVTPPAIRSKRAQSRPGCPTCREEWERLKVAGESRIG